MSRCPLPRCGLKSVGLKKPDRFGSGDNVYNPTTNAAKREYKGVGEESDEAATE